MPDFPISSLFQACCSSLNGAGSAPTLSTSAMMSTPKIKRREVAHAMGKVLNADLCRRNELGKVAHVRARAAGLVG